MRRVACCCSLSRSTRLISYDSVARLPATLVLVAAPSATRSATLDENLKYRQVSHVATYPARDHKYMETYIYLFQLERIQLQDASITERRKAATISSWRNVFHLGWVGFVETEGEGEKMSGFSFFECAVIIFLSFSYLRR